MARHARRYGFQGLDAVRVGETLYLGGHCRRFGCVHTFLEHDGGRPGHDGDEPGPQGIGARGGRCRGTVTPMSGPERPCECIGYVSYG